MSLNSKISGLIFDQILYELELFIFFHRHKPIGVFRSVPHSVRKSQPMRFHMNHIFQLQRDPGCR